MHILNYSALLNLPDRVLGNDAIGATNRNDAIGPITSRIILINSTPILVDALSVESFIIYKQSGTSPLVGSGISKEFYFHIHFIFMCSMCGKINLEHQKQRHQLHLGASTLHLPRPLLKFDDRLH